MTSSKTAQAAVPVRERQRRLYDPCVCLLDVGAHVWESVCFCASSCKSKCSLCLSGGLCVSAHVSSVSESAQLELCLSCSDCYPLSHNLHSLKP